MPTNPSAGREGELDLREAEEHPTAKRLRLALAVIRRYGEHAYYCESWGEGPMRCTCGFDAAYYSIFPEHRPTPEEPTDA